MLDFIWKILSIIGKSNIITKLCLIAIAFSLIIFNILGFIKSDESVEIADEIIQYETGSDIKKDEESKKRGT